MIRENASDRLFREVSLRSGANYSFQIAEDNGATGPNGHGFQSNYIMTAFQQGQLYFENASSITVEGCELAAAGQTGVWMQGFVQNVTVVGNVIRDTGFCGMYVSGYCRASSSEDRRRRLSEMVDAGGLHLRSGSGSGSGSGGGRERARLREAYHSRECVYGSFESPEEAYVSKGNTIAHNYLLNGNLAIGGYAGILLYESGENLISHNVIKRYARDAVGLFGSELAFGEVQDGVLVDYNSSNRFSQTKSNLVSWNDMSLTNQDSDDTGEIEMYGTGFGNTMEYNALHDIYDSSTGAHSVLFSDDWSPNTTWHSNLVGPFVKLAGGGDCDFFMIKSIEMRVTGNVFADSTAHKGGDIVAYEFPVSDMSMTRNIWFNTTRMNPKQGTRPTNSSSLTQHFFPAWGEWPYGLTTDEFYQQSMPGCPESWTSPCPHFTKKPLHCANDRCSWSFPLGKGGFDLPASIRSTQTISEIDFNYYAGLDPSVWNLQCIRAWNRSPVDGGFPCFDAEHYDRHGVLNATATELDAAKLFHRPTTKENHELSIDDYTVRSDSVPAIELGFVPWDTTLIGPQTTRFTADSAMVRAAWQMRVQGEDQDRMEGVHPVGALGGSHTGGPTRAIGSAPQAGGSVGAALGVTPGGWSRYERLDFGAVGMDLGAVSARVSGAGTLVFTLQNLEGSRNGVRIATLNYNVSALANDPFHVGWAVARTTNITAAGASLSGLHTVYVQFWPAVRKVVEAPVAKACAEAHCQVEGQTCKPNAHGSISIGYICCGKHGSSPGNWCPDMSIPCGPEPRRQTAGKLPRDYGSGCMNTTASAASGAVVVASTMQLDYFVLERKAAYIDM